MTSQPISLLRGQNHVATIRVELGGAPLDLSTASAATFTAKPSEYSPVVKIVKALGSGVTAAAVGYADITITANDAAALDISGSCAWTLTATVGGTASVVARGVLTAIGAPQQFVDEGVDQVARDAAAAALALAPQAAAAAVAGLGAKGGTYYPEDFGPVSATVAISHTAIQAAIDAAAVNGGTVVLPPQLILLGASLRPKSGVKIQGVSPKVTPDTGNFDIGFTLTGGSRLSFPGGIIFDKDDTGPYSYTDFLSRFSIVDCGFENCQSILRAGSRSHLGLSGGVIQNVYGTGITGWAFDLANIQHINMTQVMVSAVGGLHVWCDSRAGDVGFDNNTSPGNSEFVGLYIHQPQSGTVYDGILIENVGGEGIVGYLSFVRPQINRYGDSDPSKMLTYGIHIKGTATNPVAGTSLYGVDCEGTGLAGVRLEYAHRTFIQLSGVLVEAGMYSNSVSVANSYGTMIYSPQVGSKVICDDEGSAASTFMQGDYASTGNSNKRPLGMYRDRERDASGMFIQWDIYNASSLLGTGFGLVAGNGAEIELSGAGYGFIAKSAAGVRYKLVPPNGGGAATWVAA